MVCCKEILVTLNIPTHVILWIGPANLIVAQLQYIAQLVCIYLVNIPEPVQYAIYTLASPFDLRCKVVDI